MPNEMKNIYETGVPQEELDRLRLMSEYPNSVIQNLLAGRIHAGTKVIDAGSGPDAGLWKFVEDHGGRYLPFDINSKTLHTQQENLTQVQGYPIGNDNHVQVKASVLHFPYADQSVEVVNMRFVLEHLPQDRWNDTIKECTRVASNTVLVSAHDWSTMRSEANPEFINSLVNTFQQLAQIGHINLYAGQNLENWAAQSPQPTVQTKRYKRLESDYSNELRAITNSALAMVTDRLDKMNGKESNPLNNQSTNTEIQNRAIEKLTQIKDNFKEAGDYLADNNVTFVPPDIVTMQIEK